MAEMYPFDPSMTKASNKVVREQHVITSTNFRNYHYVIPHFAPFFAESLTLKLRLPSGQMRDLVEGRDYYLSHQFLDASATTNRLVMGSISFLDTDTEGVLEINYHTIGGQWTLTPARIIEIMANNLRNPRITSWEFVADVPERFPVVDHPHDIHDFKTMADVQRAVDGVRDAVLQASGGGLSTHINDRSNPHQVTKAQVGLGSVQNYGIATKAEAEAGVATNKYMTPIRVAEAIAKQGGDLVTEHASRVDNPHAVTKTQVGLGSVANYAVATQAESESGTSNAKYMTPLRVADAIKFQVGNSLATHIARTDNPHNVNKTQIGLFNVENYLTANADEARSGDRNDRYMTPLRTTQLVQQYVFGALTEHTANFSNPHNVTKAQVGLGLVDNFGTATVAEAQAGVANDRFMTPARTAQAIEALAIAPFNDHINNLNNPHQVTKGQIGLGNVQNYGVATLAEAQAGTSNVKYMTPYLVKNAVAAISSEVGDHALSMANPHNVTKAQVGLGNVLNYGIAGVDDALNGASNELYMTPFLTKSAIDLVRTSLQLHELARDNPHNVTKSQVGLSNVQNYAIATLAEAQAGTVTNKYMTPYLVKQAVTAVQSEIGDHATSKTNPHEVTKAQVGLSNVDNFATASLSDMQAGTATNRFVTPLGVKTAISAAITDTNDHIAARDNPHGVTAEQVGAYTQTEVDALLQNYLGRQEPAMDSNLFYGMTPDQVAEFVLLHEVAENFRDNVLSDISSAYLTKAEQENSTAETWYEIHSMTNNATTGGSAERSDGFAIVTVGGARTSSGRTTTLLLRTFSRITTGAGIRVDVLGGQGIEAGLKFGYVRSNGVIKSYVRVPANGGQVRVVEYGNIQAYSGLKFTTSPSGYTEVAANDVVADLGAVATRVGNLETSSGNLSNRVGNLETTTGGHATRIGNLETAVQTINTILQGITIV